MAKPEPGDLWRYDYLWSRQHGLGETEGRKARPVAMVAMLTGKDGRTALFILPITSAAPQKNRLGIEIPQMERRRAGLDDLPLWVMIDEYNHDVLEASYYFDPAARIGSFSAAFHKKVLTAFVTVAPRAEEPPCAAARRGASLRSPLLSPPPSLPVGAGAGRTPYSRSAARGP